MSNILTPRDIRLAIIEKIIIKNVDEEAELMGRPLNSDEISAFRRGFTRGLECDLFRHPEWATKNA